jgi:hypothetical protein
VEEQHPIITQRNALAARNLDLGLEVVYRDQRIAQLEARVKELEEAAAAPIVGPREIVAAENRPKR